MGVYRDWSLGTDEADPSKEPFMITMKAIACVLAALFCGFLTIVCVNLSYDAFTHADYLFGPALLAVGICIAGLTYISGLGAVVVVYEWGYEKGFKDGKYQGWLETVQAPVISAYHAKDEPYQLPKPCGICKECQRHRLCEYPIMPDTSKSAHYYAKGYEQGKKDLMSVLMNTRTDEISPDWGSIHENTATKKLHPPLVKLGQGDYEKNYPKSDDGPGDVW